MGLAGPRAMGAGGWPFHRVSAWPAWLAEALAPTLMLTLALVVRWPHLLDWPTFTDESTEVLLSLAIADGSQTPWTNVNSYNGPWHAYLLAGLFKLGAVSIWMPRGLVMAFNVAAVGLTYALGRRLGGWRVALVAAGLAALSPLWVLINSHIAWAASTTPTYVLGAVLAGHLALGRGGQATWTGERRWQGAWLALAGCLLGLAGQTHPAGLLIAPALALAVAWGRIGWRRLWTPWPWLGLAAAVAAYAPVLIYNVLLRPGSATAEIQRYPYLGGPTVDPAVYAGRAPRMWWAEAQMMAGMGERGSLPAWGQWPVAALTLAAIGLAGWGAVTLWRRGDRLTPLAAVSIPMLLPVLTGYSGELVAERYAASLVGLVGVMLALGLDRLARWRWWLASGLALALVVLPLASIAGYYQQRVGSHNRALLATVELLAPVRSCVRVVLDRRLNGEALDAAGTSLRALRMTLSLAGIPWELQTISDTTLPRIARREGPSVIVVGIIAAWTVEDMAATSRLTRLARAPRGSGLAYEVYRYGGAYTLECERG
jgi:hypothetical protein